jgi:hypothetical protein
MRIDGFSLAAHFSLTEIGQDSLTITRSPLISVSPLSHVIFHANRWLHVIIRYLWISTVVKFLIGILESRINPRTGMSRLCSLFSLAVTCFRFMFMVSRRFRRRIYPAYCSRPCDRISGFSAIGTHHLKLFNLMKGDFATFSPSSSAKASQIWGTFFRPECREAPTVILHRNNWKVTYFCIHLCQTAADIENFLES